MTFKVTLPYTLWSLILIQACCNGFFFTSSRFKKGIWDINWGEIKDNETDNENIVDSLLAVRAAMGFIYAEEKKIRINMSALTTEETKVSTVEKVIKTEPPTFKPTESSGIIHKTLSQWKNDVPDRWKKLTEIQGKSNIIMGHNCGLHACDYNLWWCSIISLWF